MRDSDGLPGKTFFVTSELFSGNLNGTAGADLQCQLAATKAGLSGTYRAWLARMGERIYDRISITYPLRRPTGLTIFATESSLVAGIASAELNYDEFGNPVPTPYVWTNTDSSGYGMAHDCGGWMTDLSSHSGTYGRADVSTHPGWTSSGTTTCNQKLRLYCIEQ